MTSSPEALEALARAYDREDASQRGEPTPWETDGPEIDFRWRADRIACAQVGLAAYLASSPEGRQEAAVLDAKALDKLQLWFFRDISDDERLSLFSIFGMPVDEIGKVHGHQRRALKHVLRALIPAKPAVGVVEARDIAESILAGTALMRMAIECGDPQWELRIRINDILDDVHKLRAALQAPATPDAQTEVEK